MRDDLFFRGIAQEKLPIRQYQGWSPMFFPKAILMGAVFTADREAVQALMPTPWHRPLLLSRKRSLVAMQCFEYQETQLGPYSEVVLSVPICEERGPLDRWLPLGRSPLASWVRLGRAAVTAEFHAYVFQLPVDSEVALFGGLDYFNVPKTLATVSYAEARGRRSCTVTDASTGQRTFRLTAPLLRTRWHAQDVRSRRELTTQLLHVYPLLGGRVCRASAELNLLRAGMRLAPWGVRLELGQGAQADELRRLDLGPALQYLYAPECQLLLRLPEPLPHERRS